VPWPLTAALVADIVRFSVRQRFWHRWVRYVAVVTSMAGAPPEASSPASLPSISSSLALLSLMHEPLMSALSGGKRSWAERFDQVGPVKVLVFLLFFFFF
jgi:hypothetical protein